MVCNVYFSFSQHLLKGFCAYTYFFFKVKALLFLYLTYSLTQIFAAFNRTDVSFFKQVNKYVWKTNYPNFLYALYKG